MKRVRLLCIDVGKNLRKAFVPERKGEQENAGDNGQGGGGLAEKLLRTGLSFLLIYLYCSISHLS